MKNRDGEKKPFRKSNLILIAALILFAAGIVFLLIDPVKAYLRQQKVNSALKYAEEIVEVPAETDAAEETTAPTFVVDRDANQVNGESYDFFGTDEEIAAREAEMNAAIDSLPQEVTLTYYGILKIDSIELNMPVWNTADVIALRYGGGHYEDSADPGEDGNCTILAHHMRDYGSMFNRLGEVEVGDEITLTTMDSRVHTYEVYETKVVYPQDLLDYIAADSSEEERLTLVTCTYTSEGTLRLLVFAHPVD